VYTLFSMGFTKGHKKGFKKGYIPWNKGLVGTYSVNKGKKHPRWKGGKKFTSNGYVLIYRPNHPNARSGGFVLEHRLVMEKHLRRFLDKKEIVHHINQDKIDNRIKNLQLFANISDHQRNNNNLALKAKCPACGYGFNVFHG